jgi:predicted peptidase
MHKKYKKKIMSMVGNFAIFSAAVVIVPFITIRVTANPPTNDNEQVICFDTKENRTCETEYEVLTKNQNNIENVPATDAQYEYQDDIKEYFAANERWCYSYETNSDGLPYHLFTPSEGGEMLPLIVWLHGSGESNTKSDTFMRRGLMPTLTNWNSDGAKVYLICPQLAGPHNNGHWNTDKSVQQVKDILDDFIKTHDVDVRRIYIVGHSLGGQGSLYMSVQLSDYFAACVALSPYDSGADISSSTIPIIVYVGDVDCGEDVNSINYATSLGRIIGQDNILSVKSGHGALPSIVFTLDDDKNGRSDIIEWLLSIEKIC